MKQLSPRESLLYLSYFRFDFFAWSYEGDEYHKILNSCDALTTKGDIGNRQEYFVAWGEIHEMKVISLQLLEKRFRRPTNGRSY